MPDRRTLLHQTADLAADFLEGLRSRPVHATATHDELLAAFDGAAAGSRRGGRRDRLGPGPDRRSGADRQRRTALLRVRDRRQPARCARGRLADERLGPERRAVRDRSPSASRRGGGRPAAGCIDLFGLPGASRRSGSRPARRWRPSRRWPRAATACSSGAAGTSRRTGCSGAPRDRRRRRRRGARRRSTSSLQMLGLGRNRVHRVEADEQGRMRPDRLREVLAGLRDRPVIVCAQSGNVNTGAFDPLPGDRGRRPRAAERVAPRRRRVRAVGGGRRRRFAI